ncbi:MAG: hypothetical protein ABIR31_01110 [Ginsengibacter sp.]
MSDTVIKVENLSKQYRLGDVGPGTMGADLNQYQTSIRRREDPYLKICEENDRPSKITFHLLKLHKIKINIVE